MEAWAVGFLGIVVSVLGSGIGIYVGLRIGLVKIDGRVANLQSQIDAAIVQIGKLEQWTKDKERYDYEFRHNEYQRAIADINRGLWPLRTELDLLTKAVEDLRDWKHKVGDAYLPRAVDDHHRRLERIETKVFNGNKS